MVEKDLSFIRNTFDKVESVNVSPAHIYSEFFSKQMECRIELFLCLHSSKQQEE